MSRYLLLLACASPLAACDAPPRPNGPVPTSSPTAHATVAATAGAATPPAGVPKPTASAVAIADGTSFVRPRATPPDADEGLAACTYLGFGTHSCINAYGQEKDPLVKRYMKHIATAQAVLDGVALSKGEPMFGSTAGYPPCPPGTSPCGGMELGCLLSANVAPAGPAQQEAHAAVCKCKAASTELPVVGGTLACDGARPVDLSRAMPVNVAQEVRHCAECDPTNGPAACAAEMKRLQARDKELADYLEKTHSPRCRMP